jgi:hypothetical protein
MCRQGRGRVWDSFRAGPHQFGIDRFPRERELQEPAATTQAPPANESDEKPLSRLLLTHELSNDLALGIVQIHLS